MACSNCRSKNVVKNGTYYTVNSFLRMVTVLFPILNINTQTKIQKYMCKNCKASIAGPDRVINQYIRNAFKLQIAKLICLLRFKEGLSIRAISHIIKSTYGTGGSIGYIVRICNEVSKNAEKKLRLLNNCKQDKAKMMILDETFPKTKTTGTTNMGVAIDENGLNEIGER